MDSWGTFSGATGTGATARVVVLSRRQAFLTKMTATTTATAGSGGARVKVVRVESPYQAAAEILAQPTEALVVDFRLLRAPHLRLLEIARELDIAVLGVGALPANISLDELSGVQLIAAGELADALSRIASQGQSVTPTPSRSVKLTPAKLANQQGDEPDEPAEDQSFFGKANRPSELLTSEELSSLLEDLP